MQHVCSIRIDTFGTGNGEPHYRCSIGHHFADSTQCRPVIGAIQPTALSAPPPVVFPPGATIVASGAQSLTFLIVLYHKRVVFIHSAGFHRDRGGGGVMTLRERSLNGYAPPSI